MKAGGLSKVEMQECRDRIEDSLFAVKAALDEGYVVGGGYALLRAAQEMEVETENEDQKLGVDIIRWTCREPALKIIENAVGDRGKAQVLLSKGLENKSGYYGFNSSTKQFEELNTTGIIDPVKVVKNSLIYGSGAASILLTTEISIVNASSN